MRSPNDNIRETLIIKRTNSPLRDSPPQSRPEASPQGVSQPPAPSLVSSVFLLPYARQPGHLSLPPTQPLQHRPQQQYVTSLRRLQVSRPAPCNPGRRQRQAAQACRAQGQWERKWQDRPVGVRAAVDAAVRLPGREPKGQTGDGQVLACTALVPAVCLSLSLFFLLFVASSEYSDGWGFFLAGLVTLLGTGAGELNGSEW